MPRIIAIGVAGQKPRLRAQVGEMLYLRCASPHCAALTCSFLCTVSVEFGCPAAAERFRSHFQDERRRPVPRINGGHGTPGVERGVDREAVDRDAQAVAQTLLDLDREVLQVLVLTRGVLGASRQAEGGH